MDFRRILFVLSVFAIVLFGGYLRINQLDKIPNGFYVDEAAIGYNAYSLFETGKDEYGKDYPLFLRSFGAYSSPLYTYLTTIPVYLFGLNVFSVRILSAAAGTVSIFFVFLILNYFRVFNSLSVILGTSVYAITPWSVLFSRGAFEANLAFMMILMAVYLLLKSLKEKIWLIPASAILSLATYAYQAERLVSILLLSGFIILFFYKEKANLIRDKRFILAAVVFIAFQIPYLSVLNTPAFTFRSSGLFYSDSLTNQAKELEGVLDYRLALLIAFLHDFFSQFFAYLSPRNLFFYADPDLQRSLPDMSVFYPWLVIPFIIGILDLIKKRGLLLRFTVLTLISFASVSSLTKDPFSTLRSLPLVLPVTLLITEGFDWLVKRLRVVVILPIILLFIFSLLYLYRSLAVYLPNERANIWGFGFEQLAKEINKRPDEKFLIDNGRSKPAYIELAFFLKYPPVDFQERVDQDIKLDYYNKTSWDGYYNFGNLETRSIKWEEDIYKSQIIVGDELAVSPEQEKEHFLTPVFEIKDPTDKIIFRGFRTNPVLKCRISFGNENCKKF